MHVHLHLPKTAGTALNEFLQERFNVYDYELSHVMSQGDKKKTLVVRQTTSECEKCGNDWWLKLPSGNVCCLDCYDSKKLIEYELRYFGYRSNTWTSHR